MKHTDPFELPTKIDTITEVPASQRPLYELADDGRYTITPGGRQLQKLRIAMREAGHTSPQLPRPTAGKAPVITRRDWMVSIGAASPQERKHLLAAAGRGDLTIK